jgi:hypothetical protein
MAIQKHPHESLLNDKECKYIGNNTYHYKLSGYQRPYFFMDDQCDSYSGIVIIPMFNMEDPEVIRRSGDWSTEQHLDCCVYYYKQLFGEDPEYNVIVEHENFPIFATRDDKKYPYNFGIGCFGKASNRLITGLYKGHYNDFKVVDSTYTYQLYDNQRPYFIFDGLEMYTVPCFDLKHLQDNGPPESATLEANINMAKKEYFETYGTEPVTTLIVHHNNGRKYKGHSQQGIRNEYVGEWGICCSQYKLIGIFNNLP